MRAWWSLLQSQKSRLICCCDHKYLLCILATSKGRSPRSLWASTVNYWDITAPFSERRTSALVLCIHKTSAALRSSRATMGTLSGPSQCPLRHQSVLGDLSELRLALWKFFSAMQSPVWSQQSVTGVISISNENKAWLLIWDLRRENNENFSLFHLLLGLWSYAYVAGLTSFLCFALMLMLSCKPGFKAWCPYNRWDRYDS